MKVNITNDLNTILSGFITFDQCIFIPKRMGNK